MWPLPSDTQGHLKNMKRKPSLHVFFFFACASTETSLPEVQQKHKSMLKQIDQHKGKAKCSIQTLQNNSIQKDQKVTLD